jgi:hypothetical protein
MPRHGGRAKQWRHTPQETSGPGADPAYASCADLWKEHSGASRACTWLAILRFDYHALTRQQNGMMIDVVREHIPTGPPWPSIVKRFAFAQKMNLIVTLLSIAHSGTEHRCGFDMDPARRIKNRIPAPVLHAPRPDWATPAIASQTDACQASFDIRHLPYRWLPGLPPPPTSHRELLPLHEALHAPRFEVMHIADYWPGPVWLYHARGSGVWWSPGRRVVARNLVDAILKFNPMARVVQHLETVGKGDNRLNRYRAWLQWRVAFGGHDGPPWETILAGAAAGNASYEHFASAGELLGQLITADGAIPSGVDTILLREQV